MTIQRGYLPAPGDIATTEALEQAVEDAIAEIGALPPADASVTLPKLAPAVLAALLAPTDLLGVRTLDDDVVAVDADNPQPASDLMIVLAESSADAEVLATGTVVAGASGVPAVVRLLEEGEVIASCTTPRVPYSGEPFQFMLRARRPGPISLGSVGYLNLDGGYAYCADDPSFHADDYRLRFIVDPQAWVEGAPGTFRTLFGQYVDPDQHGLVVRLDEAGDLATHLSITGTTLVIPRALDLPPAEGPLGVEWARRKATGITTASITEDGLTWVETDSVVVEPGSAIHPSTGALLLGGFKRIPPTPGPDSPLTGKLYSFELATATAGGPWTTVADPDFRTALDDGPLTDSYGNVWRTVAA